MNKESAQKMKTHQRSDRKTNSSSKRKASPEQKTPSKRMKVSEAEPQNSSEDDLCIKLLKWKVGEYEEGTAETKKKRRLDDNESASSSVDTNRESSSKKKAADEGEATNPMTNQTTEQGTNLTTNLTTEQMTQQGTNPTTNLTTDQTTQQGTNATTNQMTKQTSKQGTNPTTNLTTNQTTKQGTKQGINQMTKQGTEQGINQTTQQGTNLTTNPMTKRTTKQGTKQATKKTTQHDVTTRSSRAAFKVKYKELNQLGVGGCGCVFAGYRKADNLPVAIKHIPKDRVPCKHEDDNGNQISVEVAIMEKLAAETSGSVGTSALVSLLDWYDLDDELVLVMDRPVRCVDLYTFIIAKGGSLREEEAKIILKQLVKAAKELEDQQIFHRDIKIENILIETGSDSPRICLIDYGLGCFAERTSSFCDFYGTPALCPPEWFSHCTYWAGSTTVWQVGAVLFDLLHNKAQFDTIKFIRNKLKIKRRLSENCTDFLETCLATDPEQRPTLEQLQHHPWLR